LREPYTRARGMDQEIAFLLPSYGITGLGIFVGIVAGTVVQVAAHLVMLARSRSKMRKILRVEVEHNLHELGKIRATLDKLKDNVRYGTLMHHTELFNMTGFTYSFAGNLQQQGMLYDILTKDAFGGLLSFANRFGPSLGVLFNESVERIKEKTIRRSRKLT
jgi:hypothetical protein